MPTPIYVGNVSFRVKSITPVVNRAGVDTLNVILQGSASLLSTEFATWTCGVSSYPSFPNMRLETKDYVDAGPLSTITLNFIGYISSTLPKNGFIGTSDGLSIQTVTLTTDDEESVTFYYMAQSTTTRWMYRGSSIPTSPRFRLQVPSTIPTNKLFSPNPASYTGSVSGRYRVIGNLSQFTRTDIAPNVWEVMETWETLIEANA